MSECFLGEIRLFAGNYAPENWHICDGTLLSVTQYTALFSLIGTAYGGDGRNTFGIPDLRGNVPIHQGQGPGLSQRLMGQTGGATTVALTPADLPAHTHTFSATTAAATAATPSGSFTLAAVQPAANGDKRAFYLPNSGTTGALTSFTLDPGTVSTAGGGASHANMMPTFALTYIIALQGTFPVQN